MRNLIILLFLPVCSTAQISAYTLENNTLQSDTLIITSMVIADEKQIEQGDKMVVDNEAGIIQHFFGDRLLETYYRTAHGVKGWLVEDSSGRTWETELYWGDSGRRALVFSGEFGKVIYYGYFSK